MTDILIPDVEDEVVARLRLRADQRGAALEELLRDILREAAAGSPSLAGLGSEIAGLFRGQGFEEGEIEELRGHPIRPATFEG